jgi:hypothetical protein
LIPAILQTLTLLIFVLIVIYPLLKEENRQWTQPPRHQLW